MLLNNALIKTISNSNKKMILLREKIFRVADYIYKEFGDYTY